MSIEDSIRGRVFSYLKTEYGGSPEYPWMRYPDYAVFRHADNRKWYCITMDVPYRSLGLEGEGRVYVINVKPGDPLLTDMLIRKKGYLRGYHMNHSEWVSILLDGSVPFEEIRPLIDMSYRATASAKKRQRLRPPKEWIVPANPKYYDIEHAFDGTDEIDWKQGAGIKTGDTVFMYVAAPVSAIMYKCSVVQTDIPFDFSEGSVRITALMRIKLVRRYDPERFSFKKLGSEYGIFAVRGPRSVPFGLSEALKE